MNYTIFQWINGWGGQIPFLDYTMIAVTNTAPYAAILLMLLLWFNGKGERAVEKQYTALYAVFSVLFALLINAGIHVVYYHPRPFMTHHVHQLVSHSNDSSFVSDHAALVFAIAWTFLLRKEPLKYVVLLWAMVVGVSRIFVGVHYPADILGGMLLSFGTSALVLSVSSKLEPVIQVLFRLYHVGTKRIPILAKYSYKASDKQNRTF